MGLFSEIEKLITEHGSAVILKERLSLAADKYAALEEQVSSLTSENADLKQQLTKAVNEITELKSQIERTLSKSGDPNEEEAKILVFLSINPGLTDQELAKHLKMHLEKVKFYLDEMAERKLVWWQGYIGSPASWSLDSEGRRYLIVHNLI